MLLFQLTSPTSTFITNVTSIDVTDPGILYKFSPEYSIAHIKEKPYPGFVSTHQIEIKWVFELFDKDQNLLIRFETEQTCVLLYKHDLQVENKFYNMLIASYYWSRLTFGMEKSGTQFESIDFPDAEIDFQKLRLVTDLLLASDAP